MNKISFLSQKLFFSASVNLASQCQSRQSVSILSVKRVFCQSFPVLQMKSFSSSSHSHHQVVLIIKSFSSSSRFHHQVVLIIKSYYQAIVTSHLSSQSIKSSYQATLSSRSKHSKAIVASDRSKISKYACYDRLKV
jgi:hypothetical protein